MKLVSLNAWAGVVQQPLLDFFSANREVDVFCLQEVYKGATGYEKPHPTLPIDLELFTHIQERLADTHMGYFAPSVSMVGYGIAIFIRKEIQVQEEGALFIYENEGWRDDNSDRGNHSRNLQFVRIKTSQGSLLIAHLHGLWKLNAGKVDLPDRIEQSRRVVDFLAQYDQPKILMGDFNLNPDTESIAMLEKGMRNLIKEYGITSTRTSYYEKEGKFADYAFVSPQIEVIEFKVLPEEVSDHAALYLEIK